MFIRFSIIQCATDGQTDGDGQSEASVVANTRCCRAQNDHYCMQPGGE